LEAPGTIRDRNVQNESDALSGLHVEIKVMGLSHFVNRGVDDPGFCGIGYQYSVIEVMSSFHEKRDMGSCGLNQEKYYYEAKYNVYATITH
jgi:hypothetical protein